MEIDRSAATAPMQRARAALLGLSFLFLGAPAESAEAPIRKIAVTSLIGDSLTVDTYRRRTSSHIESNMQRIVPSGTKEFDLAALAAARESLAQAVPSAEIALLAVPSAGSELDPASVLADSRTVAPSHALVAALRREAFTHVLLIVKLRALAHLQLANMTVGSGQLQGLGFYVDNDLPTYRADTHESARGFLAPYVYVRLRLIDVASLEVIGEKDVMGSSARSAARNQEGLDAWGALSTEAKLALLDELLRESVGAATKALMRPMSEAAPR